MIFDSLKDSVYWKGKQAAHDATEEEPLHTDSDGASAC